MRELHVVGLTPDGRHLLLAGASDTTNASHCVAVDARFEAALRGMSPVDGAPVRELSPRDIQARLRSGATVEQVAAEAGLPVSRVERFAGPVLSERENLLRKVYAAHQHGRRGTSELTLERAVTAALAKLSFTKPETLAWTAYRRTEDGWVARVSITVRGRVRQAEWSLAADGKTVRPLDSWAATLGHVGAVQRPAGAAKAPGKAVAKAPGKAAAKAAGRATPPGGTPGATGRPTR